MKKLPIPLVVSALIFLTRIAYSQVTVVDWGGTYVSGNVDMNTGGAVDSTYSDGGVNYGRIDYNDSRSLNPSADYTPPPGKSGVFYGVHENSRDDGGSLLDSWGFQISSQQEIVTSTALADTAPGGTSLGIQGLMYFQVADFLNPSPESNSYAFGTDAEMFIQRGSVVASGTTLRYAVREGGTWYLSESTMVAGYYNNTLSDPGAESWAAWDPTDNGSPLPDAPTTFSTLGSTFNDITAVGYYYQGDYTTAGGNAFERFTNEVQFFRTDLEATAIPEASTLVMTLMGFALLAGLRRRKQS